MRPFELPDFYMPYSARLNPHVDSARTHAAKWARETGLLDRDRTPFSTVLHGQAEFDDHDYALLCGYAHPDVPASTLNLLTDWYAWMFVFDDQLLGRHGRTPSLAGTERHVQQLCRLLTVPTSVTPEPSTPLERGLTELWRRTTPGTPVDLVRRLGEETRRLLVARSRSLDGSARESSPNPVDQLYRNRREGGARWVATLVEYSLGGPLPPAVARSRPLRTLVDTFADATRLCNDLFSYQRETEQENKHDNTVVAIERVLECSPRRAAEITNDLLTRRTHHFEVTLSHTLPELLRRLPLAEEQRTTVLAWADGLRDWLAGGHEWHSMSTRYMNTGPVHTTRIRQPVGLGFCAGQRERGATADETTLVPPGETGTRRASPPPVPDHLHAVRTNTLLAEVRAHSTTWAEQHGIAAGANPTATTTTLDHALLAARVRPDATETELFLIADWSLWAQHVDDIARRSRPSPTASPHMSRRLSSFLPRDTAAMPTPTDPLEQGLAELWCRTSTVITGCPRQRFRQHIRKFLHRTLTEAAGSPGGVVDAGELLGTTRGTGRSRLRLALTELSLGTNVPRRFLRSRAMRLLVSTFADITTLHEDIVNVHRHHRPRTARAAIPEPRGSSDDRTPHVLPVLADLATTRQRRFETLLAEDLPEARAEHGLSAAAGRELDEYLDTLRDWITGELSWLLEHDRQGPDGSRTPQEPPRPTGHRPHAAVDVPST